MVWCGVVGCGVWCVACGVVWCKVRIVKVVLGASEEWVDSCREEAGIQGMKQERLSSSVYNTCCGRRPRAVGGGQIGAR